MSLTKVPFENITSSFISFSPWQDNTVLNRFFGFACTLLDYIRQPDIVMLDRRFHIKLKVLDKPGVLRRVTIKVQKLTFRHIQLFKTKCSFIDGPLLSFHNLLKLAYCIIRVNIINMATTFAWSTRASRKGGNAVGCGTSTQKLQFMWIYFYFR